MITVDVRKEAVDLASLKCYRNRKSVYLIYHSDDEFE
jgi:hypothetical protein